MSEEVSTGVVRKKVSIEELRERAGVPDDWCASKYKANAWDAQVGGGVTERHFSGKVEFSPPAPVDIMPPLLEELTLAAKDRWDGHTWPTPDGDAELLVEITIPDVHLGMLSSDYDLPEAQRRFRNAVNVVSSVPWPQDNVARYLFVIGNDFLHIDRTSSDTSGGVTTSGTEQSIADEYPNIVRAGIDSLVEAITVLATRAPVTVLNVPGNHDRWSTLWLAHVLEAYFNTNPNVFVDTSADTRKYVHWGKQLIGFTHGKEEKWAQLPMLMANEASDAWASSVWREWHVGHNHHLKTAEDGGVRIRQLPSLAGTDAWHKKAGYVGAQKQAMSFVWSPERGLIGTQTYNV